MIKEITNARYLSEVFDFLPSDTIFNKGITGCGGTHLELNSPRNSVLLVPTVELVKNKTTKGIQPIHGEVSNQEILNYLYSDVPYKKLIGTYDSLERILSLIHPKEYFLLIDEYHLLFNAYNYRNKAIYYILQHYTDFDHFCFMSATPLDELCILKELEHLPRLTLEWKDSTKVKIGILDKYQTTKTLSKLLLSDSTVNWHVFLNSVKTIKEFIEANKITDYRVICSKSSRKNYPNLKYSSTTDPVAHYNFYTSCSFEGTDILDPIGRSVIVCDTNIATTILDISTLIRQICGRLRDSIYKDQVTLILNTSKHRYANVPESKFNRDLQENILLGKLKEEKFKSYTGYDKLLELRSYSPETYGSFYVNRVGDEIFYDDNLRKMDEYNYHLVSEIYKSSITVLKECNKNQLEAEINLDNLNSPPEWITSNIEPSRWYDYLELESIFTPIFKQHGLEYSTQQSIQSYFPPFEKKRMQKNGTRLIYYKFTL